MEIYVHLNDGLQCWNAGVVADRFIHTSMQSLQNMQIDQWFVAMREWHCEWINFDLYRVLGRNGVLSQNRLNGHIWLEFLPILQTHISHVMRCIRWIIIHP